MKMSPFLCGALVAAACIASPAFAVEAVDLSSFEGIEEPSVIYHPATDSFTTGDTYVNIVLADAPSHAFRFTLRYTGAGSSWDGNMSDTTSKDRGRAEVKGLGPHQVSGETYDYISTWRTSSNFQNTNRFAHIFQLYAVNNSSSVAFLAQMTLSGSAGSGRVHFIPGGADSGNADVVARSFTYTNNAYHTYKIEAKMSSSGFVKLSIDGDALSGANGNTLVSGANGLRPKWGLYRGFDTGWSLGDEYIEHKHVQANKL